MHHTGNRTDHYKQGSVTQVVIPVQKSQNPGNNTRQPPDDPVVPQGEEGQKPASEIFRSLLQSIVNSSPIPQFVIDTDHKVRYWNKALEKYSDIPAADMIGSTRPWKAFYNEERPTMADLLVDGSLDRAARLYEGKFSQSALISGAYVATDFFPHLGKNGTWLHFTAALLRDEQGNVLGAVETLEDITDLRQAEDLIAYMTETAMRVTHPVGIIRDNLMDVAHLIRAGKLAPEEIAMLLDTQVRNASQIMANMEAFQKAVVEKHREIPEAYRKFLSG